MGPHPGEFPLSRTAATLAAQRDTIVEAQDAAARVIQRLFRRLLASEALHRMFDNRRGFRTCVEYSPAGGKYHPQAVAHLDAVSAKTLDALEKHLRKKPFSQDEILLMQKVIDTKWRFRHQTIGTPERDGKLTLYSNRALCDKQIACRKIITERRKKLISNDDFVFFGIEFAAQLAREVPSVSRVRYEFDYGANAYLIDGDDPRIRYGYLTLTDQLGSRVKCSAHVQGAIPHQFLDFAQQFPVFQAEVNRKIVLPSANSAPIYSARHMKKALALHLVHFLRNSQDEAFKRHVFDCAAGSFDLHRIMNTVFEPEFHLPRLVSTTAYVKHVTRELTVEELYQSGAFTFERVQELVKTDAQATRALYFALKSGNFRITAWLLATHRITDDRFNDYCDRVDHEAPYVCDTMVSYVLARAHYMREIGAWSKRACHAYVAGMIDLFLTHGKARPDDKFHFAIRTSSALSSLWWHSSGRLLKLAVDSANYALIEILTSNGATTKHLRWWHKNRLTKMHRQQLIETLPADMRVAMCGWRFW